jgi:hypothetical protein
MIKLLSWIAGLQPSSNKRVPREEDPPGFVQSEVRGYLIPRAVVVHPNKAEMAALEHLKIEPGVVQKCQPLPANFFDPSLGQPWPEDQGPDRPIAWCRSDDYQESLKSLQSVVVWTEPHCGLDMPLYAAPQMAPGIDLETASDLAAQVWAELHSAGVEVPPADIDVRQIIEDAIVVGIDNLSHQHFINWLDLRGYHYIAKLIRDHAAQ